MESQNRVQWIYSSRNNQELAERYDQWAKDYEQDLAHDFEWLGPQRTTELFFKYVAKDSRVLVLAAAPGTLSPTILSFFPQQSTSNLQQTSSSCTGPLKYCRTDMCAIMNRENLGDH